MPSRVSTTRKQIRGFVIVWTFVTFIMGLATFLAIYFTYTTQVSASNAEPVEANVVTTIGDAEDTESVLVVPSIDSDQTEANSDNIEDASVDETEEQNVDPEEVALAQAAEPTATPTDDTSVKGKLFIEPKRVAEPSTLFQAGIQVQESPDFNPDNQDGWYRSVSQDLGLDWVKQQVRWEFLEENPDEYNWAMLDLVMESAKEFGIKMMLSIVTAPDWAREPGVNLETHGPPANTQDYVDFVMEILRRYPGQVHAIEVWNEQNLDREWTSTAGLRPENYVALLQATHDAVKAFDPNIIIISGALSPTGLNDGVSAWDDFVYLEMLINAGMLNYADCVGAHHNGYNIGPSVPFNAVPNDPTATFRGPFDNPHHSWSFRSTLEGYATRIRNLGYDTPLCVTEFGWPSTEDLDGTPLGFEFADDNTLEEQATFIPEALSNMENWGFVWLAFLWNFNYGPQAGWDPSNDNVPYSLIGKDWAFRPAYDALREWQTGYRERIEQ